MSNQTDRQPRILTYDFFARNETAARTGGRRRAMNDGWIGLRVISTEPLYSPNIHNYWRVKLEATERRGTSYREYDDYQRINLLGRGARVRTTAEGVSHAGGGRHVMAAGAVGQVVKREGPNVRVRFADPAGRTFVYRPADLEVLGP